MTDTTYAICTIAALIVGPIAAVQVTRWLDDRKERRDRKLRVFRALMATRMQRLSVEHVKALNCIELEFSESDPEEKPVIDAWNAYLDHVVTQGLSPEIFNQKWSELHVDLLYAMCQALGYERITKTRIKSAVYSPQLHGQVEEQLGKIRQGLVEILENRQHIRVHLS